MAHLDWLRSQHDLLEHPKPKRIPRGIRIDGEIVCYICHRPPGKRGLVYDHCHKTNVQRGSICARCNAALGLFGDDAGALRRAIRYLARFEGSHL